MIELCARLRQLLSEIGLAQRDPTLILADNQGAIILSEDQANHERTKAIDVKYHYTRERVLNGDTRFRYVRSCDNVADIFTKALHYPLFKSDSSRSTRSRRTSLVGRGGGGFRGSGGARADFVTSPSLFVFLSRSGFGFGGFTLAFPFPASLAFPPLVFAFRSSAFTPTFLFPFRLRSLSPLPCAVLPGLVARRSVVVGRHWRPARTGTRVRAAFGSRMRASPLYLRLR
jgi:hypothetical protein